jgi:uncharacterized Tic20 family protein
METTIEKKPQHLHLSALTQYFIPFGNYIFLYLEFKRKLSEFVDHHGKQVLIFS